MLEMTRLIFLRRNIQRADSKDGAYIIEQPGIEIASCMVISLAISWLEFKTSTVISCGIGEWLFLNFR